jgi:uncharacterized membrane protein (GlpM family)
MIYYIIKVVISATLIVSISEISKKSSLIGGILASVPLVSVLGMIWLYIDTQSAEKVSQFATSVFWLVIPSLSLFIVLPMFLKKMSFYYALPISLVVMIVFYYLMILVLGKFGIEF